MDHPPIPPNFPDHSIQGVTVVIWRDGGELDSYRVQDRKMIAAVARCAWLDEARALDRAHGFSNGLPFPTGLTSTFEQWREAENNAEAWRKWGQQ